MCFAYQNQKNDITTTQKTNDFRIKKRKMMCNPLVLVVFLFIALSLCACSSPVSSRVIKNDIVTYTNFSSIAPGGLDVDHFDIIKRITDKKSRIDEVWVSVTGENEEIFAVRNYKLTYKRYNDGWHFEEYELYGDDKYWDETCALTCVAEEDVQGLLEAWDLQNYASFSTILDTEIVCINAVELSPEFGYCEFVAGVRFTYPLLVECVEIPVYFDFIPTEGDDVGWTWNGQVGYIDQRTLGFSRDIMGKWEIGNPAIISMEIASLSVSSGTSPSSMEDGDIPIIWWPEENGCEVKNFYIPTEYQGKATSAMLKWDVNSSTGKLRAPRLEWIGWNELKSPTYIYPDGISDYKKPTIYIRSKNAFGFLTKGD